MIPVMHSQQYIYIWNAALNCKIWNKQQRYFAVILSSLNTHTHTHTCGFFTFITKCFSWIVHNTNTVDCYLMNRTSRLHHNGCRYHKQAPGQEQTTCWLFNTLRPRQMDAISQTTFSNAFSWMKMFEFVLKFHQSLLPKVQLTMFQQWFR